MPLLVFFEYITAGTNDRGSSGVLCAIKLAYWVIVIVTRPFPNFISFSLVVCTPVLDVNL